MRRPPVTIVILAWNAWEATAACLESLRPTLGMRDQVVVVDNGSRDATPSGLRRYPWAEVITNADNRGFAAGCNQGAAAARHDVVVFLNNDTVLAGRWLDELVAPFGEGTVGAAGPRSNFVSGPQVVADVGYRGDRPSDVRRFVRGWQQDNQGRVTDAARLVGFCLAVRRSAFEAVGGFDERYEVGGYEDDDLCVRLSDAGWRLVIAHGSFVHHAGHATFDANGVDWFAQQQRNEKLFLAAHGDRSPVRAEPADGTAPLLSACLIVRDEEDALPGCLQSLVGLADEVVVYDTGSTDGTIAVARMSGAVVVEGHWDDDFARARNAALEHCRGEWILWVDADETVTGSADAIRSELAVAADADGLAVAIDNEMGSGLGAASVHSACRLFRRRRGHWTGRLHEQVVARDGGPLAVRPAAAVRIHHTGYLDAVVERRGKHTRNLRLAEAAVDEAVGATARGVALVNLARARYVMGHHAEALDAARQGAEVATDPVTRRLATRTAVETLLSLGRGEEAAEWTARLRAMSQTPALADILEARAWMVRGEAGRALARLDRIGDTVRDEDGFEYGRHHLAALRARCLAELGRYDEAVDATLAAVRAHGVLDAHLYEAIRWFRQAGRPLEELAAALPAALRRGVLAQALTLAPPEADATLEACFAAWPGDLAVLAAAANLGPRMDVVRALEWSARLRARGLAEACPLLAIGAAAERDSLDRGQAVAAAYATFGDDRARAALAIVLDGLDTDTDRRVRAGVAVLCPALVGGPEAAA